MAPPTHELLPLVSLAALGVVAVGGWIAVLALGGAAPEETPVEKVLAAAPLPDGRTPLDEAIEAIAGAAGQGSIRCQVEAPPAVNWPFEIAHHDGMLRAVVSTASGSRIVWGPEDADGNRPEVPIGLLEWSGAADGQVGGCRLKPTGRTTVEGQVTVVGESSEDIRVRVCGETVHTDATGHFSTSAWSGQHCLVFVDELDLTQDFAPIVVPSRAPAEVKLVVEPAKTVAEGTVARRLVIAGRSLPERALKVADLSPEARRLIEEWAESSRAAKLTLSGSKAKDEPADQDPPAP